LKHRFNQRFVEGLEQLEPLFERLIKSDPLMPTQLPVSVSGSGVYLFSNDDVHLYVGRTRNLRRRVQQHYRKSSGHASAPFAFRLAREATGNLIPAYTKKGSRAVLVADEGFALAFDNAKSTIRSMQVRTVGVDDALIQSLLEIYTAVALGTPYNRFETS
jgi:hypothetical protein